jgi:Flp pilus assembly protein TadD
VSVRVHSPLKPFRILLLAGVAALALSGCAANRAASDADFSGRPAAQSGVSLSELAMRYKQRPGDKTIIIYYAAALRSAGQSEQAVAVLEGGMKAHPRDNDIRIAYAKALTAAGRFAQALNVAEDAINPAAPDWNALLVKGAILDQVGRNGEARQTYQQALLIAPTEASLEANLGLSYAMTNELEQAEKHLRRAVSMRGATSQIRQNLALVICLQGRFAECEAMFARELPPDQVEANMAYVRALLTQQNRWDLIKGAS